MIVIGAGAAGLAAMRVLLRAGVPVILLEARHRPGGRIHTITIPFSRSHRARPGVYPREAPGDLAAGRDRQAGSGGTRRRARTHGGRPHRSRHGLERDGAAHGTRWPARRSSRSWISWKPPAPVRTCAARRSATWRALTRPGRNGSARNRWRCRTRPPPRIEGDRAFRLPGGYGSLVDWLWSGSPGRPSGGAVRSRRGEDPMAPRAGRNRRAGQPGSRAATRRPG